MPNKSPDSFDNEVVESLNFEKYQMDKSSSSFARTIRKQTNKQLSSQLATSVVDSVSIQSPQAEKFDDAKDRNKVMKSQVTKLTKDLKIANDKLQPQKEQIQALKDQLKAQKKEYDTSTGKISKEKAELEIENVQLRESHAVEIKILQVASNEAGEKAKLLRERRQALKVKIKELEVQNSELQETNNIEMQQLIESHKVHLFKSHAPILFDIQYVLEVQTTKLEKKVQKLKASALKHRHEIETLASTKQTEIETLLTTKQHEIAELTDTIRVS